MRFARVLRAAGVAVGTDRVMEAVRALPLAGIDTRADVHATLSTLFVSRHEQQPVFDEAFAAFWRAGGAPGELQALPVRAKPGLPPQGSARVAQAFGARPLADAREEIVVDAAMTFSAAERLRHVDFEKMTLEEWHAAKRLIASLPLPIPEIRTRRHERAERGRAIDLAATLRRMARDGGELCKVLRRRPISRPAAIVALCDISGSMHRYTRPFLHFLHALTREHGHVSTLLFGTRLTNVTRALRHRDVDAAMAAASGLVADWGGGTRIAACLREFNFRWSRRLLAQNACVVLVTDGLEGDDVEPLGAEMARLRRAAHRVVWLNPLLRFDGFSPRAAGIRAMRPHVDAMLPVHNVAALAKWGQCPFPA